jgi:hypothetical protein
MKKNLVYDNRFYVYFAFFLLIRDFILKKLGILFIVCDKSMHLPDFSLLVSEPFTSLLYLHSQPPLLSFIYILALHTGHVLVTLKLIYMLMGLLMGFMLIRTLALLRGSSLLAFVLVVIFFLTPPVMLYQYFGLYTFLEIFFVVLMLWAFLEWTRKERSSFLAFFFLGFMLLTLTRAYVHPFLLPVIACLLAYIYKEKRRVILIQGLLFSLFPISIVVKNMLLFSILSTSSWFGINFSRPTQYAFKKEYLLKLHDEGKIRGYLYRLGSFNDPKDIVLYFPFKSKGMPIIDDYLKSNGEPNYNHVSYIDYSKALLEEELYLLKHNPLKYMISIKQGFYLGMMPSSNYGFIAVNRFKLGFWDEFYNKYLCLRIKYNSYDSQEGNLDGSQPTKGYIYLNIILAYFAFLIISVWNIKVKRKERGFWILALGLVLFIVVATFTLDLGENRRFRFPTEPIVFITIVSFIVDVLRKLKVIKQDRVDL